MEDEELVEELILRSAPGAALPEKGLDRLLSSLIIRIILRLAPQAVTPSSMRSFSVNEGKVAMSIS